LIKVVAKIIAMAVTVMKPILCNFTKLELPCTWLDLRNEFDRENSAGKVRSSE
jgi:hypothetical protein